MNIYRDIYTCLLKNKTRQVGSLPLLVPKYMDRVPASKTAKAAERDSKVIESSTS